LRRPLARLRLPARANARRRALEDQPLVLALPRPHSLQLGLRSVSALVTRRIFGRRRDEEGGVVRGDGHFAVVDGATEEIERANRALGFDEPRFVGAVEEK